MITNLIINILIFLPKLLLSEIPALDLNISINNDYWNMFTSILSCVGYVLPINVILLCIGVKLTIRSWNIPYSIILRIKSFIPTMGN